MQQGDGYGLTAFSAFLTLPPGAEQTLTVEYTLPLTATAGREPNTYDLRVRKQAGTGGAPLMVAVRLPSGVTLRTARPTASGAADWVRYDAAPLDTDRTFHLGW